MASEITVTFSDGGIFNGYASSYTKAGETTYYFEIEKKYRVQVSGQNITLQQYQNTNGSWYNIDIISAVEVKEIQSGGSGDVTLQYLQENYYSKTETDNKYVKKTGDTLTGNLNFKNNTGIWFNGADGTATETYGFFFCYNGMYRETDTPVDEEFVFRAKTKFVSETTRTATETFIASAWLYFKDSDGTVKMMVANNSGSAAIHLFKNNGVYLHTGEQNTTEQFITLAGTNVTSGNNASWNIYAKTYQNRDFIVQSAWIYVESSSAPSSTDSNLQIRNTGIMIMSNRNSQTNYYSYLDSAGLDIYPNNSGPHTLYHYNYIELKPASTALTITGTSIDIYNGGRIALHSGAASTTEAYLNFKHNSMTWYNVDLNYTFDMNLNSSRFQMSNAFTILMNAANLISAQAGTTLTLTDSGGAIVVKNIIQALNNAFYGENFLNALNQVLTFILQSMGQTYYVSFDSQNYGGGFVAGGGSSRGGGVGRR